MVLQSKNDEMFVQEDDVEAIYTDEIQSKLTNKEAIIALKIQCCAKVFHNLHIFK